MSEPIKLPNLPMEEALKRAYYYTEAGKWRYPETCNEWDRWHSVAKVVALAAEQATADIAQEATALMHECAELRAERDALWAELAAMTKRATDAEGYAEHLLTEARKTADVMAQAEAECDALRVPCRTLVSLLETDDWQATLRLAVEQARAALKEAK